MQVHPRDARIRFDPGPHTYYVDGVEFTSVTTVIDQFFPQFDSDAMSQRCAGKGKYVDMSPEQVADQWRLKAEDAAEKGTAFHLAVEDYLRDGKQSDNPDFQHWIRWYQEAGSKMGQAVRQEWTLFDEEYQIAGTLDALFQSPKGPYFLMDWKRKRKIDREGYRGECGYQPLAHVPNCDFARATLQLNTYRWLLRRHYSIEVKAMGLVQVHPESGLNTHRIGEVEADVTRMLHAWKQMKAIDKDRFEALPN